MSTPEHAASAGLADAAATPDHTARNRIVITLLLVSTFVVILNETIMSVALPRLMAALDVSAGAAQWLTTAFLLTMAVVIPITGFLIQRINTRPIFFLAMSLFSIGTLISAMAPGLEVLVFGRVIQAVGTAIMLPLLMTTVMMLVPEDARGKTMGNISIVISVAPALGPTISGFILTYLEWRWMFILVLPIALASLAIGWRFIQNVSEPRYAPLDYLSVVLSAVGFGGLVYGLSSLGEMSNGAAEGPLPGWLPVAVGAVVMVIFIWRQMILQREDKALLDLRTFQSRIFAVCVFMMAIAMMALFGTMILLPIYTQNVLGLDALQTGLMLMPGGLVMGLMAPFVGRLYDRHGARKLVIPGTAIVSAVLWALTMVDQNTSFYAVLGGHMVMSVGLALVFTPLFTAALSAVPAMLYSHGSAVLGSTQQVAGAAGVALLVALMSVRSGQLLAGGETEIVALAGGIRTAFFASALIFSLGLIASFFVRRPKNVEAPVH